MAMDKSAADAFVYAKAGGMLAKSFVGKRAALLFSARSLQELWSLLFTDEVPVVPETLLARELETQAQSVFIRDYKQLIANYDAPAPVLIALLHSFDYDNIKEIGTSLSLGEKEMPAVADISPYNLIAYRKWPDIAAMTDGSPLAWYDTVPQFSDQQQNDYRLDCQYVRELWQACAVLSPGCREQLVALLKEKLRMDNVLWALRLRIYYGMDGDLVRANLAYAGDGMRSDDPLAAEAIQTLGWELDNYEHWKHWKFASLLNPHEDSVVWSVEPRWLADAYKKRYVERAYRLFHRFPFTECPLVCWYILKQNELDMIRTASESLRLHVPASQAMQTAGVREVHNV